MKYILLIILTFYAQQLFACECESEQFMNLFTRSDFIATARILEITPDSENENRHYSKIEIIDLYKGEHITNLIIYSNLNSSCAFLPPENSLWLLFANKNKNGEVGIGFCSGSQQMDRKFKNDRNSRADKNHKKSNNRKIQFLEYLKSVAIEPKNEFELGFLIEPGSLKKFNNIAVKGDRFALYELTINKDLSIKTVKALKEFDNEKLKADLLQSVFENIKIYHPKSEKEIKNETKIIIGLHYYEADKKYESFISQHAL